MKFTELHALPLAARSYALLLHTYIYATHTLYELLTEVLHYDASNCNGIISTQDSHKTAHAISMSRINTADLPQQKADTKLFSSRESTSGHKTNQWVVTGSCNRYGMWKLAFFLQVRKDQFVLVSVSN